MQKVAVVADLRQGIARAVAAAMAKAKEGPEVPANMKPSPTMKVHFADGEVVAMNRKERRRRHLYGDRLTRSRR